MEGLEKGRSAGSLAASGRRLLPLSPLRLSSSGRRMLGRREEGVERRKEEESRACQPNKLALVGMMMPGGPTNLFVWLVQQKVLTGPPDGFGLTGQTRESHQSLVCQHSRVSNWVCQSSVQIAQKKRSFANTLECLECLVLLGAQGVFRGLDALGLSCESPKGVGRRRGLLEGASKGGLLEGASWRASWASGLCTGRKRSSLAARPQQLWTTLSVDLRFCRCLQTAWEEALDGGRSRLAWEGREGLRVSRGSFLSVLITRVLSNEGRSSCSRYRLTLLSVLRGRRRRRS